MSPPLSESVYEAGGRIEQPARKGKQHSRKQHPHRRLGRSEMRQSVYELKLGSGVAVMSLGIVGVRVHDGHPVYHVRVGKQRNATYI